MTRIDARLKTTFNALLCCAAIGVAQQACAGVVVGATRVIFDEGRREVSVPVKNVDQVPFVVQAWVDGGDGSGSDAGPAKGKTKAPFLLTPPLSRLDPGKENLLRVMQARNALPSDRESMFRLNFREIPEVPAGKNVLQIAVHTRIKLFYRPGNLPGKAADAPKQLQWSVTDGGGKGGKALTVTNPTPYYVTFASIEAGDAKEAVDIEAVAPFAEASLPLKHAPAGHAGAVPVRFKTINDFGATIEAPEAQARF
ncbi:fimbrial biogenesis chaperone [Trinickia mobilis]|uniref:fimbrial biogenesis chaperone n=1 Tax=Trinickia mobilis TaxID=2816356 RepID=UPI001A8CB9EF|nr:molecular chaperone [Trinickia mobilis]